MEGSYLCKILLWGRQMLMPFQQVYWHKTLPLHFYRLSSLDMKSVFDLLPSCIANLTMSAIATSNRFFSLIASLSFESAPIPSILVERSLKIS